MASTDAVVLAREILAVLPKPDGTCKCARCELGRNARLIIAEGDELGEMMGEPEGAREGRA